MAPSVVWDRRIGKSSELSSLNGEDKVIYENVNDRVVRAIRQAYFAQTTSASRWINSPYVQEEFSNKIRQIQLAKAVGFSVPDTLFSNDPARIRDFIESAESVVAKPLFPIVWPDGSAFPTSEINSDDTSCIESLKITPLIFQQKIEKSYEIRALYFSGQTIAASIKPKSFASSIDWRIGLECDFLVDAIHVEQDIELKMSQFCKHAGLEFAVFDFAVASDGGVYFLEINVQGQWLWMELLNPELPIFDFVVRSVIEMIDQQALPAVRIRQDAYVSLT